MSDTYTTPVEMTFRMQRQSIEQGHRLFEQGLDAQAAIVDAMRSGLDASKTAQKQGVSLGVTAVRTYLDMVEMTVPGSTQAVADAREAVDEQFEAVDEMHDDAWESVAAAVEESLTAYDEFTEGQREAVADAMSAFEDASEEFESQATRAVEETAEA